MARAWQGTKLPREWRRVQPPVERLAKTFAELDE
jgi:hypothetical protein